MAGGLNDGASNIASSIASMRNDRSAQRFSARGFIRSPELDRLVEPLAVEARRAVETAQASRGKPADRLRIDAVFDLENACCKGGLVVSVPDRDPCL
jgi:hypothetical protein